MRTSSPWIQKEDKRTHFYKVNDDVSGVICNVLRHRERKLLAEIKTSAELLSEVEGGELEFISLKRLQYLKTMIKTAQKVLDAIIFTKEKIPALLFDRVP